MSSRAGSRPRRLFDPFVAAIFVALGAGLVLPASGQAAAALATTRAAAIAGLFALYGARLRTGEVWAGLRNLPLQASCLAVTFGLYPLLAWALVAAAGPWLGAFAAGVLYLGLLPSTVQSAVTFTSIAGGNVAGAVVAATVSTLVGVVATPLLVAVLMGAHATVGLAQFWAVCLQLLAPFVCGQLTQPLIGQHLRAHPRLTRLWDQGTIVLIVYASISAATLAGTWRTVTPLTLAMLLAACLVLLVPVMAVTWWGGARLGLRRADRITLLMCGSTKSLATGLPMAAVLFAPAVLATVTVPVVVFHQLQLAVKAVVARRLGQHPPPIAASSPTDGGQ